MKVKCNYCEEVFDENEIVLNEEDDEICPYCHVQGCISDYPQTVEDFEELYGAIPEPCGYKMEIDDVEHNVIAVCKNCGAWQGTYQPGYGWAFSSDVDFADPKQGLCSLCSRQQITPNFNLPQGVVFGEEELGMAVEKLVDKEDVGDFIGNLLSNKYGFCVNNFTFHIIDKAVVVNNIEWDITE